MNKELQNKKSMVIEKPVVIEKPKHTEDILDKDADQVIRHNTQDPCLTRAIEVKKLILIGTGCGKRDGIINVPALLENQIEETTYQASIDLPVVLDEKEKNEHGNAWCTYREQTTRLETQRGQA